LAGKYIELVVWNLFTFLGAFLCKFIYLFIYFLTSK